MKIQIPSITLSCKPCGLFFLLFPPTSVYHECLIQMFTQMSQDLCEGTVGYPARGFFGYACHFSPSK